MKILAIALFAVVITIYLLAKLRRLERRIVEPSGRSQETEGIISREDEPKFTPEKWNSDPYVTNSHNCYSYALDDVNTSLRDKCRDLLRSGKEPSCLSLRPMIGYADGNARPYQELSCDAVRDHVQTDNPSIVDVEQTTECPDEHYKIGYAINAERGWGHYHFYRQDADGTWSHKDGGKKATQYDESGERLVDPALASRGNYKDFCGYMCVPKNSHAPTYMDTE